MASVTDEELLRKQELVMYLNDSYSRVMIRCKLQPTSWNEHPQIKRRRHQQIAATRAIATVKRCPFYQKKHQTFLVLKSVFGGKTAVGKMVTVVTILENYEEEMQSSSPV
ncbi:uncharacterized protein [Ptychodera flava]|uniref:uncharacterized protein isoform X1 n=1 Tax=Ptychodera flava TaxID=63121 RepID=UPI00396A0F09